MNYKVMKRPMFKLGGKANSQGTGVTSGLDERVNLKDAGFLGTGMSQSDFGALTPQGLMDLQASMLTKGSGGMNDMRDIIKLQAISNLAGNVLPNIESGGLRAVTDFLRDPQTTQTAIQGLTGLKRIDMAQDKMRKENLSNLIKNQMQFKLGERKYDLDKEQFQKLYDVKLEQLDINRAKSLIKTATQIKLEASEKANKIFDEAGGLDGMTETQKRNYFDLRTILGDMSPSKAKQLAINTIEKQNADNAESGMGRVLKRGSEEYLEAIEILTKEYLTPINFAEGGRVNRAMGTPMMGEQPMTEQQDVAMETQEQGPAGQNAYAMLRARLPQEVSDEVVKLIAYNKEAFADFASIKNQEDVSSFNDKYGVQLVIDVATV
jgi:tetratricopeptide (TPR) repeat protein